MIHPLLCNAKPNFYPRSPCGERRRRSVKLFRQNYISIHALLAESDITYQRQIDQKSNFYPRSPCGERRVHYDNYNLHCVISIHALLAESDLGNVVVGSRMSNFYPRSPCGERPFTTTITICTASFLSTLSLRRATINTYHRIFGGGISIHALLAESDTIGPPSVI